MSISNLVTKTIGFVTVAITIVVTKKRENERWLQKEREREVVTKRERKRGGYKNKTVTKKTVTKRSFPPGGFSRCLMQALDVRFYLRGVGL